MIFAKVDVDLSDHAKAVEAGLAMATWLWALLYSRKHELDGLIPASVLRLSWVGEGVASEHASHLVRVGLWKKSGSGFAILNYDKKNETKVVISQRREEAKERMRLVRTNRQRTLSEVQRTPIRTQTEVPGSDSGSDSVHTPEGSAEGVGPSTRGTRLPDGWQPNASTIAWCRKKCIAPKDVEKVLERMSLYFQGAAGAKGVKGNWDKAFQTWALRELDEGKITPTLPATIPDADLPPERLVSPQKLLELGAALSKIGVAS